MTFRLPLAVLFACWATTGLQAQLLPPLPPLPPPPVLPLPPPPLPNLGKLDTLLRSALDYPALRSRVIVRATGPAWLDALSAVIAQAGGTLGHRLTLVDAQAAVVPNVALPGLTSHPFVARIASDRLVVATLERTGAAIGADEVRDTFGYDGTGVGVAVIDSGISQWHDDLGDGAGSQRVDQFVDLVNGRAAAYDDHGHGTHVAGIIAGNGFDSGGARTGIAPGARLLVVKALDADGRGRISDVIAAFASVIAAKEQFGIRIVNVSIGAAVYESYDTDLLTVAAKLVVDSGLILVASAGNNGSEGRPDGLWRRDRAGQRPVGADGGGVQPRRHRAAPGRLDRRIQFARPDQRRLRGQTRHRRARRRPRVAERSGQHASTRRGRRACCLAPSPRRTSRT